MSDTMPIAANEVDVLQLSSSVPDMVEASAEKDCRRKRWIDSPGAALTEQ
jgi:hypothetical protein